MVLICAVAAGIGSEIVLAVGDGPEEEAASMAYQLPFIKVYSADDLARVVQMVESQLEPSSTINKVQPEVQAIVEEIDKIDSQSGSDCTSTADAENVQSSKRLRKGSF